MNSLLDIQLKGTPYSIPDDELSRRRFSIVQNKSVRIRDEAIATQSRVAALADELLGPFSTALRSEQVAESNRIEGYEWTAEAVRVAVETHRELMAQPVHHMLNALKSDSKIVEALGLFRAHLLADDLAKTGERPREAEIRGLHQLILASDPGAGRYKRGPNRIAGSAHTPVDPLDVDRHMHEMVDWWRSSGTDPILDATLIHAWLTHVHPFDDGNGRLARLLANLTLIQSRYPPLILRSDSDRGQYYDALAQSDEGGDVLPLYELFANVTHRTVRLMGNPNYVREIVDSRLLGSVHQSHQLWSIEVESFAKMLNHELRNVGWRADFMGIRDLSAFRLLLDHHPEGNGWFLVVKDGRNRPRWLLWFGFNSKTSTDMLRTEKAHFPSIFFSIRDETVDAVHPYRQLSGYKTLPDEVVVRPAHQKPVFMRWDLRSEEHTLSHAIARIVPNLVA